MSIKTAEKKKLLILNGSHSEIPLIQAGKKLGFHVITTGNDPDLIGHNYSDEYHSADFSDLEASLALSKKLNIDAICSSANDFGAITASYVAEEMGLPGHDPYKTTLILHHKDLFKEFALKHQIPTPYAESFNDIEAALAATARYSFPLIIKPIDLTGGKGISKIHEKNEYADGIKKAFAVSRAKRIVVEEFIEGTQHSFSTFIVNGKVAFYFSDNEYSYLNPYLVSTSAAPASNVAMVAGTLIAAAEKIVELLSLENGVFHMQYIFADGEASILEITRRCSGDLYPYPVDCSTGLDWASWIVKAEAGLNCLNFPAVMQTGYCGRHCIMSAKDGIVKNVIIDESIKNNIYDELSWWKEGDVIDNYMVQKLGIVFFRFDSMEEMLAKIDTIHELIQVEMF